VLIIPPGLQRPPWLAESTGDEDSKRLSPFLDPTARTRRGYHGNSRILPKSVVLPDELTSRRARVDI